MGPEAACGVEPTPAIGYCRATNSVERQSVMPSSSAVVLALAVLGLGAASALAQSAGSRVVVYPTQGAASGSTRSVMPGVLPAPPPGPIESRIVALPDGTIPALPAAAPAPPPAAPAPMGQPV